MFGGFFMKMKRFLVLLLAFCLVVGHFSFIRAKAETPSSDVWDQISLAEEEACAPVKGSYDVKQLTAAFSAAVDTFIEIVESSDDYQEGSIEQHGSFFYWKDASGMTNCYSPSVRAKVKLAGSTSAYADSITWEPEPEEEQDTTETKSNTKPTTNSVGIIQPFFGIDTSFTEEYFETAKKVAKATGGSCAAFRGNAVTIDRIAALMSTCGVVIFDSHGSTDYQNPYDEDDATSQANTSYLVITCGDGLEDDLYATSHQGDYGTYYDVCSGGSGDDRVYFINGNAIAKHMSSNAPDSLLWMGICLGMATDTLYKPLQAKGVKVISGYSQSVTFKADYAWKDAFFDSLIAGNPVKTASADMKNQVGTYDPYVYYYPAYPIIVSPTDAYPGHGNVDAPQTVTSTWTLKKTASSTNAIKMQPESQQIMCGDTVDFSVVAIGSVKAYQWQVSKDNGSTWSNISTTKFPSAKTSILSFTTTSTMKGYKYRCRITFSDDTKKYSSAATLTFKTAIVTQPSDSAYIKVGGTATFSISVSGSVKKYQWQVCKDGYNWSNISTTKFPSAKTKKLQFTVSRKSMDGYTYRCVVTASDGSTLTSDYAVLNVYGAVELYRDYYYYNHGETAYLQVFAAYAKSYVWQVSKDGGSTWKSISTSKFPSAKTDCLTFPVKTSMDGYQYRCKVTFDDGTTKTTSGTITLNAFGITKQPVAKTVSAGKKATFSVTVNLPYEVYKYQWQVSKDGGKTWKDISTDSYASASTDTLSFTAKSTMNGYYYRCQIESWYSYGYIYTNKVKLTVN